MNKISLESAKVSPKFESGELFSDEGVGVYMLCEISNKKWVAVSLIDGRWLEPSTSARGAVRDLTFLGHGTLTMEY